MQGSIAVVRTRLCTKSVRADTRSKNLRTNTGRFRGAHHPPPPSSSYLKSFWAPTYLRVPRARNFSGLTLWTRLDLPLGNTQRLEKKKNTQLKIFPPDTLLVYGYHLSDIGCLESDVNQVLELFTSYVLFRSSLKTCITGSGLKQQIPSSLSIIESIRWASSKYLTRLELLNGHLLSRAEHKASCSCTLQNRCWHCSLCCNCNLFITSFETALIFMETNSNRNWCWPSVLLSFSPFNLRSLPNEQHLMIPKYTYKPLIFSSWTPVVMWRHLAALSSESRWLVCHTTKVIILHRNIKYDIATYGMI